MPAASLRLEAGLEERCQCVIATGSASLSSSIARARMLTIRPTACFVAAGGSTLPRLPSSPSQRESRADGVEGYAENEGADDGADLDHTAANRCGNGERQHYKDPTEGA